MEKCIFGDPNIKKVSANSFSYYGYIITRNGEFISPSGNLLHAYDFTYPNSHVTLRINNKNVKKNKAILVYELFSGKKLQRNKYIIQFKDGNRDNAAYDNLYVISRPEYWNIIRNDRNTKGGRRFTEEEENEIRQVYQSGQLSMRQLCNTYDACLATIQSVIKRGNEPCEKKSYG